MLEVNKNNTIFASAIFTSVSVPPIEGRGIIIGLVFVVLLAVPIAILLSFRETSYIIAKDRLFF